MRITLLALATLTLAFEASAQTGSNATYGGRGQNLGRTNGQPAPGGVVTTPSTARARPGQVRTTPTPGYVQMRPTTGRKPLPVVDGQPKSLLNGTYGGRGQNLGRMNGEHAPGGVATTPSTARARPGQVRSTPTPGYVQMRPTTGRKPLPVAPRYVSNSDSQRKMHANPMSPMDQAASGIYSCSSNGQLSVNEEIIHDFQASADCLKALDDVQNYQVFCDKEDLYEQTGVLEAQFNFNDECRDAIGFFY